MRWIKVALRLWRSRNAITKVIKEIKDDAELIDAALKDKKLDKKEAVKLCTEIIEDIEALQNFLEVF